MKKIVLVMAVVGLISLASCEKIISTRCTLNTLGIVTTVTVTNDEYETCIGNICQTNPLNSETRKEHVEGLEDKGYSCN
jgi:CobQ-like glutamine amidotransferase family enzyme